MYLGVQPDPFYDNEDKKKQLIETIETSTADRSFSLRIFYTPLNAPALDILLYRLCLYHSFIAVDITYKWNALIDQSYRDGCDYIYQYSYHIK